METGSSRPTERESPAQPSGPQGSWSIGLFAGASPLVGLQPAGQLDSKQPNPIITCASVTDDPSSYVADPFLFRQPNGTLYIFFESKSIRLNKGIIGASASRDSGASWQYLGTALNETFHLSYPFVFEWEGQVYMLPEAAQSGAQRLYRAVNFPLDWAFDRVLVDKPLVDSSLVEWQGRWWLFATDKSLPDGKKNAELEIYHAPSPLGPWKPHPANPVMSGAGAAGAGARMAGRPLVHDGQLYRFGQVCSTTYGRQVLAYRVDSLTLQDFKQSRVPFEFGRAQQRPPAARAPPPAFSLESLVAGGSSRARVPSEPTWNAARHHHLDALQLPDGSWLAVMDGDSVLRLR